MQWQWETALRPEAEVRWSHEHVLPHHWTSLTIPFSLVFLCSPSSFASFASHLPSWWYRPALVRVAGEQFSRGVGDSHFHLLLTDTLTFKVSLWSHCLTTAQRTGWKHSAGQTGTCHGGFWAYADDFIIIEVPCTWWLKNDQKVCTTTWQESLTRLLSFCNS